MMVSGLSVVYVTAVFVTALGLQNPPAQTANGFRPPAPDKTTRPDSSKVLSPETRGDIFVARKMYREAIESYQTGPRDSAVLANKTGIAYHQLQDFADAKRSYERAIRLNSSYAEAINNLGTVFYAQKSLRRAIS